MANITPVVFDLEFTKNDDWVRDIPVWADSDKTIAFPFTNWTGIIEVKKSSYGNPVIATFQTSDGSMVLSSGNIHLKLLKAVTNIPAGTYHFDAEFNDDDGFNGTKIEKSIFEIKPEITDGSGL